ncbi:MAG: hypothetical protein V7647_3143 [Acidobacteriota bacterium]|jgi:hypothetical protein
MGGMAARKLESEIDRLYQLPPDEFTAARNALAKTAGANAAEVKRLAKPPIAAWAVNQIYWRHRDVYEALVSAAKELRQTHKAILAGRAGDLRAAGKAHDAAVDQALKLALSTLADQGHPATDVTRQAIATTLRALPGAEPPGRLTGTLQPGGFEMLAGLSIGRGPAARTANASPPAPAHQKPQPAPAPFRRKTTHAPQKAEDPKALAKAREAAARAARELRDAEHTARREEFEAARATRDAEKAARELQHARDALAAAQREVEEAEAAAAAAERTKAAAEARAQAAERALEAAKRNAQV